ncbi:S9 family peptidase [Rhodohalobacter halophilus]|uniref:S9 family peptidase n=1 Tax=Rhodohalobacter halophilus TaxID=1812810 RepID=UPI00083F75C3|nr:S9 family peptidase [Rhodohalobacter halophilus]
MESKNYDCRSLLLLLCLSVLAYHPTEAQNNRTYQSLQHALFSGGQLIGERGPKNVKWIAEGESFSYLEQNLQHFAPEIRIYNPATETDTLLFHPAEYTFPDSDIPFHFEKYEWSDDGKKILFQTNFSPQYRYSGSSDFYLFDRESDDLNLITFSAHNAEISPNGQYIAYHRDGEMFLYEISTESSQKLTTGSEPHLYNGRFGWVYEEEFGLAQAWEWSHDSRYIAYWQTDERHVERFISTDYEGTYPEYTDIPYPKAGSENPSINIGVIDIETGRNHFLDVGNEGGLIPRIYWTANSGELAVIWMNRQQTELKLYLFDVNTGQRKMVYDEKPEWGWIDIYLSPEGLKNMFYFPDDRQEFFRISDRDGFNHIYRYDYNGTMLNRVTEGAWEVTNLFTIDTEAETIFFESTEQSPLERDLYSIRFDGSEKVHYTRQAGRHNINMSPNGVYYIDKWSDVTTPVNVELYTTRSPGKKLVTFTKNKSVQSHIEQLAYQPRELFSFKTDYGVDLDGYLIRPHNFDPDKTYPLILMVYGGPGYQGVMNEFETSAWVQYLSQQGYVIANVNNRGSGGYGRDFKKAVHKKLGLLEAEDFAATAKYLGQYDWIDTGRIAIRGHSYGGFMAALTPLLYPNLFKVSLVGAPVTDWRLYDTIYTERYMGLPEENRENYNQSSIMPYASSLRANMLVAHSAMDENVHIQNTMQMVTAFVNAGKDVDLRIFPKGQHGVIYNEQSYLLLYKVYTDYLNRHLKP